MKLRDLAHFHLRRRVPWHDGLFIVVLALAFFTMLWFMINSASFMLFGTIITHVNTKEKVVALTLDDGPLPGTTEQTLDLLKKEKIVATFFVIGVEASRHPQQLKEIVDAGEAVGNHSFSHKYMTFMSPSEVKTEIENNDTLIRNAGYTGTIYFRTPYNAKFVTLPYYLMSHNRPDISRDVIPTEGANQPATKIANDVVSRVSPGSIILLHPMYAHTKSSRDAIPLIARELKARGYRFVTVEQLLAYQPSKS